MLTQTALATIGAFFYNLVSDLVGGIEVVVLEESHLETPQKTTTEEVKTQKKNEQKETVLKIYQDQTSQEILKNLLLWMH
jgi:hypothetical protein